MWDTVRTALYEGVTHAGVLVVARDSGAMLLIQRAMDDTDAPEVQETWEMPGGALDGGEDPLDGAWREYTEETGLVVPVHEVVHGWRGGDADQYQGFVVAVDEQLPISPALLDPEECQNIVWVTPKGAGTLNLRPEFAKLDLTALVARVIDPVSGNEDTMSENSTEVEPDLTFADLLTGPIPVHGVLAPEDTESGDSRGFNAGAVTRRPYRLPLMHQKAQTSGHDGAVVVGSVDRLMRKDGLIHWEGSLMPSEDAGDFAGLLAFFGRFGVSVDGDRGTADIEKTEASGVLWFDAVRAAGLTAVSIPAFSEAYVTFGPHPEMPDDAALVASAVDEGNMVEFASGLTFKRGPGWVTNPKETRRLHDYWMPGHPGGAKIAWGTPGDFTRAKKLIGEKIGANSPEDMKYLNQIIAQWHHDALGYWPGDLDKPGNDTTAEARAKRKGGFGLAASQTSPGTNQSSTNQHKVMVDASTEGGYIDITDELFNEAYEADRIHEVGLREDGAIIFEMDEPDINADTGIPDSITVDSDGWEMVLTSSAGTRVLPSASYFERHPESGALMIEEPDEFGVRRVHGYAAEWGVCHIGFDGRCVGVPEDPTGGDYPEFHLGRTVTDAGPINTGLITYKVNHRGAKQILSESAEQAHFDNIAHAWAAIRLGEDDRGVWFSGVVLPHVSEEDLVLIEAAGQVSGEWKYGALRGLQAVNIPGFPVMRASAEYNENGEVVALVASTYGQTTECQPTPAEMMAALAQADAEVRFQKLRETWGK